MIDGFFSLGQYSRIIRTSRPPAREADPAWFA
jgi:hypothetical protein